MASFKRLVEMLQRAKDGPPCLVNKWEREVIPNTVKKFLKKYDLEKTFNKEAPVNQDLELADRFFQAGLDLAEEIGLLCIDTETVIKVSRDEILAGIKDAPSRLTLGRGEDQVVVRARRPEGQSPAVFASPLALHVDEDLYVPIMEGILKSRDVNMLVGLSIDTVFGRPMYSGTPFETVGAFLENRMRQQALWQAGRMGMPNFGICSSMTEYGQLGGFPGLTSPENPAVAIILEPAELKISYPGLHKAASAIGYGGYIASGCPSIIGGYSGGAEGAALANIATDLLQFSIMQAHISNCAIYDVRYNSTCGRHGLWALSIVSQALSRNTHTLNYKVMFQMAGPCSKEFLYSSAAGIITSNTSGLTIIVGLYPAGGSRKNYITPLGSWFGGEMTRATGGLSLERANELVLWLLEKYEHSLGHEPIGKNFYECFDADTLKPSPEWQNMYLAVKEELIGQGIELE
jgi:methylamine--corrinoid protein Co-methyltransferase